MFYDRARIYVKAGNGGNGVVSFRKEKFVSRGGPNGGNGGRGGNVVLYVDPALNTLYHLQHGVHHRAEAGAHGGGANRTGAHGADLRIPVPPGTVARHAESGELLADLVHPGEPHVVVQGGRGGRGNAAFKTAHNSAPRLAEKGEQGEELWLELELKLVADVGIIGVPNAGKSTLLSRVSAARPKVADYPFTTVAPTLGVAEIDHHPIVMVDIPGLLEGAHEGVGLGLEFLRHIERCRVLIHLLDGASPDPAGDLEAVNQELTLFNPALADKPQRVVLNKLDLPAAQAIRPVVEAAVEAAVEATHAPLFGISALTGEGIPTLLREIWGMLALLPTVEPEERVELVPPPDHKAFQIDQIAEGVWRVEGIEIEKVAQMTQWDYYEAALRFQRVLSALGIKQALVEAGIEEGDSVRVGNVELVWGYENAFGS